MAYAIKRISDDRLMHVRFVLDDGCWYMYYLPTNFTGYFTFKQAWDDLWASSRDGIYEVGDYLVVEV